jgi:protein-S-isoprenylcysteine O-methyltransferase Ste14
VLQFALIALVVVACLVGPRWPSSVAGAFAALGAVLAFAGAGTAVWAARSLGRSLTPFPRPVRGGPLATGGPYGLVRHPIYSGGILFFAGVALAFSPLASALTGLLALVWALKLRVEERFLEQAYPAYAEYRARTRYRLVPFVY